MHKYTAQRIHSKARFFERFGVRLGDDEVKAVIRAIRNGETRSVGRQSNRVVLHEVCVRGIQAIAVYDKSRKNIATFLSPEMCFSQEAQ